MSLPAFVSFAGIDGSGKSTQARALTAALRGAGRDVLRSKTRLSATYSVFALSERLFGDPHGYHPHIPATLREFVVAADVVQHFRTAIAPALAAGRMVVWDRGPLCYHAYAQAYGAQLDWVSPMLRLVPWPEVTFLLDVDPELAWKRICAREEKAVQTNEEPMFLQVFREHYLALAADRNDVIVLDAARPERELTAEILHSLHTLPPSPSAPPPPSQPSPPR